ncbi:MAG TPA: ADOP family duplicated permease [Acidobacteriota bacterium]|nr:ADOP family duplicated permease [Acidobacteriota bacterium]
MRVRLNHRALSRLLSRRRLTQNAWAQRLDLDKGHLSRLVQGKQPYPGPAVRRKLLRGLEVEFEDLFIIEDQASERPDPCEQGRHSASHSTALEAFRQDLRYAYRSLRQKPVFVATALLILTLGIGANSAIFSVVNSVLLQPLPFRSAQELVFLWSSPRDSGSRRSVSFADFQDWESSPALSSATAFSTVDVTLKEPGQVVRIPVELVTAGYLPTLGLQPYLGTGFSNDDSLQVMVAFGYWRTRLGGDPDILGRSLDINALPWTVVGVMPEGYGGIQGGSEMWLPVERFDELTPQLRRLKVLENRRIRWLSAIGRLSTGVTPDQARAQLDALAGRLEESHPDSNENLTILLHPARDVLVGDFEQPLTALSLAVAGLLLLACANLAHLILARSAGREKEMAIRLALGAGRPRLLRQLLLESSLLGLAGGLTGLLAIWLTVDMLARLSPLDLPPFVRLEVDWTVAAATLSIALAAGLLFGMAPAWKLSATQVSGVFKGASSTLVGGGPKRRLQALLVTAEVALCLSLLIAAGLVLKGVWKMSQFDPGFEAHNLAALRLELPQEKYDTRQKQGQVLERVRERLEAHPEIRSAALASHIFYAGGYLRSEIVPKGYPEGEGIRTLRQIVSPEFFDTLGISLRRGRFLESADLPRKPVPVVISRGLALELGSEDEALGQEFQLDQGDGHEAAIVVGIVDNVKPYLFRDSETLQLYSLDTNAWSRNIFLRLQGDFASVAGSLRGLVRQVDPDIPIFDLNTLPQLLAQRGRGLRSMSQLLALFALLAIVLAVSGVYGVVSQTISGRRSEIGLRLALGAGRADILMRFLLFAARWSGLGIAAGLLAAWSTTGLLRSHLYQVDPLDVQVFLGVALLLSAAALGAAFLPALRASRSDPLKTLRLD